jgi:hypothetical protein
MFPQAHHNIVTLPLWAKRVTMAMPSFQTVLPPLHSTWSTPFSTQYKKASAITIIDRKSAPPFHSWGPLVRFWREFSVCWEVLCCHEGTGSPVPQSCYRLLPWIEWVLRLQKSTMTQKDLDWGNIQLNCCPPHFNGTFLEWGQALVWPQCTKEILAGGTLKDPSSEVRNRRDGIKEVNVPKTHETFCKNCSKAPISQGDTGQEGQGFSMCPGEPVLGQEAQWLW